MYKEKIEELTKEWIDAQLDHLIEEEFGAGNPDDLAQARDRWLAATVALTDAIDDVKERFVTSTVESEKTDLLSALIFIASNEAELSFKDLEELVPNE